MPWLPQAPAAGESLPQCFLYTSGHALDFMPTWPLSCPPCPHFFSTYWAPVTPKSTGPPCVP